jgi:hypothetical protein
MVYGDMGFLPWFDMPEDYHFGGHTFVICGYDGKDTVLASDMDQKAGGLKKGFYYPVTLEQLRRARNSQYKPFQPKNTYLEFDFSKYRPPGKDDIYSSIHQTIDFMMNPPISNFGVKGIRRTSKEILKWSDMFDDYELRMNLFTVYIFIEIGGTGSGCFRYMYSRFLQEAAAITSNSELEKTARMIYDSGKLFTKLGKLFEDAETATDIDDRINRSTELFTEIADKEEETYKLLTKIIPPGK